MPHAQAEHLHRAQSVLMNVLQEPIQMVPHALVTFEFIYNLIFNSMFNS